MALADERKWSLDCGTHCSIGNATTCIVHPHLSGPRLSRRWPAAEMTLSVCTFPLINSIVVDFVNGRDFKL